MKMTYRPRPRTEKILRWTLEKVNSVPYDVPTRWAFYRVLQEVPSALGQSIAKRDYSNFIKWTSRARRCFWEGWTPWTFCDDTREIIKLGEGFGSFGDWVKSFESERPTYEKFSSQKYIVTIWFEARAMIPQFVYYAAPYHIPLVPFGGDIGPDYKWRIAEFLTSLVERFPGKPVVVLYFGDYEPIRKTGSRGKGISIPLSALSDIRPWFEMLQIERKLDPVDIHFERCGLNPEHIERWGLPDNPERPGEYQWESLGDEQARELIVGAIERYWSHGAIEEVERKEERDVERWMSVLRRIQAELGQPAQGGEDGG